jgi:hypothetical protein
MHESCSKACVVDRDFLFWLFEYLIFLCFGSSSVNLCQANRMLISKMKRCMILDIITCSYSLLDWSNAWYYTSHANTKFGQMWGFITHFDIFLSFLLCRSQILSIDFKLWALWCWRSSLIHLFAIAFYSPTNIIVKRTWLVHEIDWYSAY